MRRISKFGANMKRDVTNKGFFPPNIAGDPNEGLNPLGTIWWGGISLPLPREMNNFRVLSTDYENYALLYACSPVFTSELQGKEQIVLLTRSQFPNTLVGTNDKNDNFGQLPTGIRLKIEREFDKFFGPEAVEIENKNRPIVPKGFAFTKD